MSDSTEDKKKKKSKSKDKDDPERAERRKKRKEKKEKERAESESSTKSEDRNETNGSSKPTNADDRVTKVENKIEEYTNIVRQLEETLLSFQSKIDARFEDIEDRFEKLEDKLDSLDEKYTAIEDKLAALNSSKLDSKVDALSQQYSTLEDKVATLDLSKLDSKVDSLNEKYTSLQDKVSSLANQVEGLSKAPVAADPRASSSSSSPRAASSSSAASSASSANTESSQQPQPSESTSTSASESTYVTALAPAVDGEEEEELQDLGAWEDALSAAAKELVIKYNLSKRTWWEFPPQEELKAEEIKALIEALQKSPKQKKVVRISLNLSSTDVRMTLSKSLAAAMLEKPTLQKLTLYDPRRQTGWSLLNALVEADSSVVSVTIDDFDWKEFGTAAQCARVLSSCKWHELILQNTKKVHLRREEVNPVYDNIVSGLAANSSIKRIVLKNIPGSHNGDISRFLEGIKKNKVIKQLELSLEDIWDRLKYKLLADFLNANSTLEQLKIAGVDKSMFDINEVTSALQSTRLKVLDVSALEISGKFKGILIDFYLSEKLKKIVEANGHLVITGVNESVNPKPVSITP